MEAPNILPTNRFQGKRFTFRRGYRVPFIARWLNKIPSGETTDEFACTLDLLPTICEFTKSRL